MLIAVEKKSYAKGGNAFVQSPRFHCESLMPFAIICQDSHNWFEKNGVRFLSSRLDVIYEFNVTSYASLNGLFVREKNCCLPKTLLEKLQIVRIQSAEIIPDLL